MISVRVPGMCTTSKNHPKVCHHSFMWKVYACSRKFIHNKVEYYDCFWMWSLYVRALKYSVSCSVFSFRQVKENEQSDPLLLEHGADPNIQIFWYSYARDKNDRQASCALQRTRKHVLCTIAAEKWDGMPLVGQESIKETAYAMIHKGGKVVSPVETLTMGYGLTFLTLFLSERLNGR